MDGIKGKSKNAFNHAAHPHQENKSTQVPEMIKKDSPYPARNPPAHIRAATDRNNFQQRWDNQVQSHKTSDPFQKIDQKNRSLTQEFNHQNKKSRGMELG